VLRQRIGRRTDAIVSALPRRRVAVIDENEIFRLGLRAALEDDANVEIVFVGAHGPIPENVDVVIVSARTVERERFRCPVVVCADHLPDSVRQAPRNRIAVVLDRGSMTAEQLIAGVHAAAAGLRVNTNHSANGNESQLSSAFDARRREVLRLLAQGSDTYDISQRLCYSVRTIKSLIADIEHELCATSRAQAVAEGIRRGII
jgi:DNA-binding NarL/FixJ family response regulator